MLVEHFPIDQEPAAYRLQRELCNGSHAGIPDRLLARLRGPGAYYNIGNVLALATGLGTALSILLEAIQTFLPPRIPSNLDVVANGAGAAAGALAGVALAHWLLSTGPLRRLRTAFFAPGAPAD